MKVKQIACSVMSALPIVLPFGGYAETEMVNGITWTYTVSNGKASLVQRAVPQSTTGAITIPTTLGGNPVTSIGSSAFSGCSGLTSVTIPDSVTRIGKGAFSGCSGIVGITLPFVGSKRGNARTADSVLGYIFGEGPYSGGTAITQRFDVLPTNVAISPEPVYTVTYYIPNSLKEVVITDETVLGFGAFSNCKGLTSVTVGKRLSSIGERAFTGCSGLIGVTLPFVGSKRGNTGAVDSVFGYIFGSSSYTGGKKITQCYDGPENSPSIVYYIPSTLKSVTVTDESVLGYGAFYGCAGLTNVVMNSGVTSIGGYSFRNCTGISELVIADSVETIGVGAFRGSGIKKSSDTR